MKIILDNIIFSLQKSGGISSVWFELLSRILNSKNEVQCLNYTNNNIFSQSIQYKMKQILSSKLLKFPERYINPRVESNKEKFIFHSSYYRTCSNPHAINITTVHDFTYEYYNNGIKKLIHSWQKRKAILKSDYIICISENTKKDLLHFIPEVNPNRIRIVYNGVSEDYYLLPSEQPSKNIPFPAESYAIFVGSRAKYKNFELTIKAISQSNLNLVIVGAPLNKHEQKLVHQYFKEAKRVHCTGYIDNKGLNILYNNAFAFLYPSINEGFGIPILEAQKAGCPVIAYKGSSIPEIIGDDTLLINESSTSEIQRCISILQDEQQRTNIIKKGLKNTQRFSWDKMYDSVLAIYKEAWNSK